MPIDRTKRAGKPEYCNKNHWKKTIGVLSKRKPFFRQEESQADPASGGAAQSAVNRMAAARASSTPLGAVADADLTPSKAGLPTWVPLGPLVIPFGQTYSAARVLVSGRITSIAIHPTDPATIYLGTAQGGVWKTTTGGSSWTPLSDHEASLSIGSVVIDPSNPDTIYAATGEGNFSLDSYYGVGVLKSSDGGRTWDLKGSAALAGRTFSRLALLTSQRLLGASNAGLYASGDAGESWRLLGRANGLPEGPATDVVSDPGNPDIAYASYWGRGVFKTVNASRGVSSRWTQLSGGLPGTGMGRIALAIAPSAPLCVYALMAENDKIKLFYASTDGGATWTQVPKVNLGGQGFYNIFVTVDPTTPDCVYLCGISLWKAVRGPAGWTVREIGKAIHADHHALAIHPSNHLLLYSGNDGGIYRSLDGGAVWDDSINKGLTITQYQFIDDHPTSGAVVFGGTQDNGTEMYRNHPVFIHADDGDGGCCLVHDTEPTNVLSTYYMASPKLSVEGGKFGTWERLWDHVEGDSLFYPPMVSCGENADLVAIGTDQLNLDSDQGTARWRTKIALPGIDGFVSAIAYVTPTLLYAATTKGQVYAVRGPRWKASLVSQVPLPIGYIWDIAALPGRPDEVICVLSGFGIPHVWRGTMQAAGAAVWTPISNGLPDIPVNALAIHQEQPRRMFIGTDVGVFETVDGGANWTVYSNGLPNCAVFDLKLNLATGVLRAATHGRGLWEVALAGGETPASELYLRSHLMDTARLTPAPAAKASFEDPLRGITLEAPLDWWMTADLKVDSHNAAQVYQMAASEVDYVAFETRLEHRQPQPGHVNRIYVQVHNRGLAPARDVRVKVLWTEAAVGLPKLAADFWTEFPADAQKSSAWSPVGPAVTIERVDPLWPAVVEWEWTAPADSTAAAAFLVVIESAEDRVPAVNRVQAPAKVVPADHHVGLLNVQRLDDKREIPLMLHTSSRVAQRVTVSAQPGAPALGIEFPAGTKAKAVKGFKAVNGNPAAFHLASPEKGGELDVTVPTKGLRALVRSAAAPGVSVTLTQSSGRTLVGGCTLLL